MHDSAARKRRERQKEQIKQRYNVVIDPENYEYIPAKKQVDYYDNEVNQRVAIYVRVSTDDVRQTTSYELQKKYYEEFVTRHPNWTLVNIYADEGISGTSLKHRDEFNRMIADCRAGKIDMIVTKSVSRFARNVEDFIGTVRSLAERRPPVGVFFESEAIFSLNDDSQMALTFQATMAEEESHTRSRSMETSLRMRLDHGVPLNVAGRITDEKFSMMSKTYEDEQAQLKVEIQTLQQEIEVQEQQIENLEQFIQRVRKYEDLDELTPYALRELVKAIYIEAPDKSSGKRHQGIRISYDLVGFIPVEELLKQETA